MGGGRPLNQPQGQSQSCTQGLLAPPHLACVGFVIIAGQVEQAMEYQYLELCSNGMAVRGLAACGFNADSDVACDFFLVLGQVFGGERKYIRGLVFAAKAVVEIAEDRVSGEQNRHLAAETNCGRSFCHETGQRAIRG
jgi:hypothetical protein